MAHRLQTSRPHLSLRLGIGIHILNWFLRSSRSAWRPADKRGRKRRRNPWRRQRECCSVVNGPYPNPPKGPSPSKGISRLTVPTCSDNTWGLVRGQPWVLPADSQNVPHQLCGQAVPRGNKTESLPGLAAPWESEFWRKRKTVASLLWGWRACERLSLWLLPEM